uniref:Metacaspase n=1 Tax=Chlorobium chlorochromatii (strain CaD3) TaxID=340177 RepID=Q3AS69_CHLCH
MAQRALLVGINDYAPIGPGGPDLRGCVNDVQDMANTLSVLGIIPASPVNMRILTDGRATKAAILDGLQWLTAGASPGDTLVFHYAGHGSQVLDISDDEPDGKDETICPHDFATAGMILDDDLAAILGTVPTGVNFDVIIDACHSGTGARELSALTALSDDEAVAYRFIEPPIDWGFFLDSAPSLPVRGILKRNTTRGKAKATAAKNEDQGVGQLNHILWAGCQSNQTSAEATVNGQKRGLFTATFCKILRSANGNITRKNLEVQVSRNIRAMGYSQIPQLEGASTHLKKKAFT